MRTVLLNLEAVGADLLFKIPSKSGVTSGLQLCNLLFLLANTSCYAEGAEPAAWHRLAI